MTTPFIVHSFFSSILLVVLASPVAAARVPDLPCESRVVLHVGAVVCTQAPLTSRQVALLNRRLDRFVKAAPRFLQREEIASDGLPPPPTIYVLTLRELNDSKLFDVADGITLLGRYQDFTRRLFVSRAIFFPSSTDLEHELMHWAVEELALPDDVNEDLAVKFERFLAAEARARRLTSP